MNQNFTTKVLSVLLLRNLLQQRKEEGKIILLTSHNKEDIESICNQVVYMQDGKMLEYKRQLL